MKIIALLIVVVGVGLAFRKYRKSNSDRSSVTGGTGQSGRR